MLTATLLVSCRDRTGLVAALSDFVFRHGGNIIDLDQHAEADGPGLDAANAPGHSGLFFMRLVVDMARFDLDRTATAAALAALAARFELQHRLLWSDRRPKVAIFASTVPHCLYDLLLTAQLGDLAGDIVAVIANHEELATVAGHFGVPFHCVRVDAGSKGSAEARQEALLTELGVELVVLARYMQILSPAFVARRPGAIINIHHSFLPAFVGAKPYHQAKARGVKVIGATAHYVTAELDQGPIIDQDVARVSHRDAVEDLIRKGRELERQVLTRAVRLHLEHRVLISGNRTIVFG